MAFFCIRPDGQKKAYVRLAPDYDALDVANKVCDKRVCNSFHTVLPCQTDLSVLLIILIVYHHEFSSGIEAKGTSNSILLLAKIPFIILVAF